MYSVKYRNANRVYGVTREGLFIYAAASFFGVGENCLDDEVSIDFVRFLHT